MGSYGANEIARVVAEDNAVEYAISVIIPVYNVEDYLAEAIESVLHQSIGHAFTQIILVDDGSTDSSLRICQSYRDKHPDNIIVESIAHAGVSAARNAGLRHVKGKYVNFLDGDDKWSGDAFFHALSFILSNPCVSIVALRHWFFGAQSGPHPLDYKFKTTRVINVRVKPGFPQVSFSNALVDADLLQDRCFDTRLSIAEDFTLMSKLVADAGCYGVVKHGRYYYRKRKTRSSAMDSTRTSLRYFTDVPNYCFKELIAYSKERFGCVLPYIQSAIMYDLRWRLDVRPPREMSAAQKETYKRDITEVLSDISDVTIFTTRDLTLDRKVYAYAIKHGLDLDEAWRDAYVSGGLLCLPGKTNTCGEAFGYPMAKIPKTIEFTFFERVPSGFRVEGYFTAIGMFASMHLSAEFLMKGAGKIACRCLPRYDKQLTTAFHGKAMPKIGFEAFIPWDGASEIDLRFRMRLMDTTYVPAMTFGRYVGLASRFGNTYWVNGDAIVRCEAVDGGQRIIIEPYKASRHRVYERDLRKEMALLAGSRFAEIERSRKTAIDWRNKHAVSRWLICDRAYLANDNGEALFSYLCANPVHGVHPIFAISNRSADFNRLAKIGDVVALEDKLEFERALLTADLYISSAGDIPTTCNGDYVKDLHRFKYVFLQHGVTKDDVSGWINRWVRNVKLFVSVGKSEAESLVAPRYGYSCDEVKITGFPRHDGLVELARKREPSKTIYLMPTWRNDMAMPEDPLTKERGKIPGFKNTDYFKFFNALITDGRLLALLEKHDYTLRMVMHPQFKSEASEFEASERVSIEGPGNYREMFADAAMLVTDYSSTAFDVALLEKPVVYAQYDADIFYAGHSYEKGYFSYEEDGFGPICHTVDETVAAIEQVLESHCVMADEYVRRVREFYFRPAGDTTRCQILVEELVKLARKA